MMKMETFESVYIDMQFNKLMDLIKNRLCKISIGAIDCYPENL